MQEKEHLTLNEGITVSIKCIALKYIVVLRHQKQASETHKTVFHPTDTIYTPTIVMVKIPGATEYVQGMVYHQVVWIYADRKCWE